jgi:hypothetical protein
LSDADYREKDDGGTGFPKIFRLYGENENGPADVRLRF